jgi:hypothetical protein
MARRQCTKSNPIAGLICICVGNCDVHGLDGDDDNMNVGLSEIVLDHQARAGTCDRGVKARMIELEVAGAMDTAHESLDDRSVFGQQAVCVSPRDILLRTRCRNPVQRLVQIHDQTMEAVGTLRKRGELGYASNLDLVVFG